MQGQCSGKPQVCRTVGSSAQTAGWRLLRACESREQGILGRDTPSGNVEATTLCRRGRVRGPGAMSMQGSADVMLPGCDVHVAHVAHVARAPTPFQCSHVPTWKVAPTAPTAASGPGPPSIPGCSRQESQAAQEKVPCRHGRGRETRASGIRVHGSIDRKFERAPGRGACSGWPGRGSRLHAHDPCVRSFL
jgi:hypothetical protein